MSSGIATPPRVENGRLHTESGEAQLKKVIGLMIADGDSENPFAELGLQAPVFDLNNRGSAGLVRRRINQHFERLLLQGRARLDHYSATPVGEELRISIAYEDLQTGQLIDTIQKIQGVS